MNSLPIVHREMRVASRSRWTYWTRSAFAVAGILAALFMFYQSPVRWALGVPMLWLLSVVTMGLVLFYGCLLTADCISSEKRDDTLGFLFLTNLKGLDVVAGKIAINAVTTSFGLLAVFPVFFLPILAGGVTWPETLRVLLAIAVAFLFALTLGVWVSTRAYDARNAVMTSITILALLVVLPLLYLVILGDVFRLSPSFIGIPQLSPGMLLFYAREPWFVGPNGQTTYWSSILLFLVASGIFTTLASRTLPKIWRLEGPPQSPTPSRLRKIRAKLFAPFARTCKARLICLSPNPFADFFLTRFTRSTWAKPLQVFALFLFGLLILFSFGQGNEEPYIFAMMILFAFHAMAKFVFAFDVTRALNDDKRSSALELLLITVLGETSVAHGQADAFRKRFRPAMRRLLIMTLILQFIPLINPGLRLRGDDLFFVSSFFWGAMIWTWSDYRTFAWFGMRHALKQQTHLRAMIWTLAETQLFPWAVYFVGLLILAESRVDEEGAAMFTYLWAIGAALLQSRRARRRRAQLLPNFLTLASSK